MGGATASQRMIIEVAAAECVISLWHVHVLAIKSTTGINAIANTTMGEYSRQGNWQRSAAHPGMGHCCSGDSTCTAHVLQSVRYEPDTIPFRAAGLSRWKRLASEASCVLVPVRKYRSIPKAKRICVESVADLPVAP